MGTAFVFGDDVDTDQIIPAQYLTSADPDELAEHCLEGADPLFADHVKSGDVIVAGTNFGCGSSREHAALAIKGTGVDAVVAESFARIFFRNAINIGLPVLIVSNVTDHISEGDQVTVNLADDTIVNETANERVKAEGVPDFVSEIIDAGGLIEYGQTLSSNTDPHDLE